MESKKENQLSDLIKEGLAHSIAQAFLIFSGILVIFSIWQRYYVSLSFFTLFYALINFKIEAIRKHPSLGNYGMRDNYGAVLYTIMSWSLLIWWIIGSMSLFGYETLIDIILGPNSSIFLILICFFSLNLWIVLLVWWMCLIFDRKREENNSAFFSEKGSSVQDLKDSDKYYYVKCCCENCDLDEELRIPKRIKVVDVICPKCKIAQQLKIKEDKEVKIKKVDANITAEMLEI